MADMPERIYANDANHWHPFPGEEGTAEYVRADIYAKELSRLAIESKNRELALAKLEAEVIALQGRVQFLEKALEQAVSRIIRERQSAMNGLVLNIAGDEDELAQYLKEKKEE